MGSVPVGRGEEGTNGGEEGRERSFAVERPATGEAYEFLLAKNPFVGSTGVLGIGLSDWCGGRQGRIGDREGRSGVRARKTFLRCESRGIEGRWKYVRGLRKAGVGGAAMLERSWRLGTRSGPGRGGKAASWA